MKLQGVTNIETRRDAKGKAEAAEHSCKTRTGKSK